MAYIYNYKAQKRGKFVEGFISGESEQTVRRELSRAHLQQVKLRVCVIKDEDEALSHIPPPPPSALKKLIQKLQISTASINQSLEQIGFLLESGVPILRAFQLVGKLSASSLLREAYITTAIRISTGESLTKIMREELSFVDSITLNLIAVGEANGTLDQMFGYAATLRKEQRQIKVDMMMALLYPALITLIAGCIIAFLIKVIFPKILAVLVSRNVELPALTEAVLVTIAFLETYGLYILLFPFAFGAVITLLRRDERLGYLIDYISLELPLIGKMNIAGSNAVWTRTLGMLMHSGVQVVQSLYLCSNTLGNLYLRKQFSWISDLVKQGHPLSTGVQVTAVGKYCPLAESMLRIGENTGKIDDNLFQVSDFYKDNLKIRVKIFSTALELIVILSVALFIGFVYIGFFLGLMALSRRG